MKSKIILFSLFILSFLFSGCSIKFGLRPSQKTPSGIYHTVQKGETLWRISQTYDSSVSEIKNANNLKTDTIFPGQRLLIPNATEVRKVPSAPPSKPPIIIKPAPKKTSENPVFARPISGIIISTTAEAEREKKITFEGSPGEILKTSREGQVFFVGETKGYSSTIIVDHLDGYYSVYGGDIEITVQKGKILAGDSSIGKMLSTRQKPKLFFEIRRGTEPVNPLVYLKK